MSDMWLPPGEDPREQKAAAARRARRGARLPALLPADLRAQAARAWTPSSWPAARCRRRRCRCSGCCGTWPASSTPGTSGSLQGDTELPRLYRDRPGRPRLGLQRRGRRRRVRRARPGPRGARRSPTPRPGSAQDDFDRLVPVRATRRSRSATSWCTWSRSTRGTAATPTCCASASTEGPASERAGDACGAGWATCGPRWSGRPRGCRRSSWPRRSVPPSDARRCWGWSGTSRRWSTTGSC